jgi:hypothetical protein
MEWNSWRQQNPNQAVDFSGVDFTLPEYSVISFVGFGFGDNANFSRTTFGSCHDPLLRASEDVVLELLKNDEKHSGAAIFLGAKFGKKANFSFSVFGVGARFGGSTFGNKANFEGAAFGEMADFRNVTFGENANFTKTTFADEACFRRTVFGGESYFKETLFGHRIDFKQVVFQGRVTFSPKRLGDRINFAGAVFENDVFFQEGLKFGIAPDFRGAVFHRMSVWRGVEFGKAATFIGTSFVGSVDFGDSLFGEQATFVGASFVEQVDFSNAVFGDKVRFDSQPDETLISHLRMNAWVLPADSTNTNLMNLWRSVRPNPERFPAITFRNARFAGYASFNDRHLYNEVDFAYSKFSQPPEFRNVMGHDQLHWARVRFGFRGKMPFLPIRTPGWTTDHKAMTWLRRLRKIANEIHDTDAERDIFVLERMAERGVLWKGDWRRPWRPLVPTILMGLYRIFSNYGRSVVLPLLWLVGSNVGFYFWYDSLVAPALRTERVADALYTFTLANAVPFVGATRQSLGAAIEKLFSDGVPPFIQALSTAQGILSAVFIFLAALALRNFFKVK